LKIRTLLAVALFFSLQIFGQSVAPKKDSTISLEPVIITANKIEQKQRETGKVLTVITSEELKQNSGKSLGEILNQKVGIMIGGSNSTPGSVQTLYVRGAAPANTLILLDGVPVYDASGISGEFDLNTFIPAQIERVEILKGAQSTLYGSDAVAGVINIISKKPAAGEKIVTDLDLSAASFDTYRASVQIRGMVKGGWNYFAGYNKLKSDGFTSAYDSTGKGNYDNDGVNQDAFVAGLGIKITDRFSLNSYFKYGQSIAGIDAGAYTDDKDYTYNIKNTVIGLRSEYHFAKGSLHLNFQRNEYNRNYLNDSGHIGGYSNDPFAFFFKYNKEAYQGTSHFAEAYTNISFGKGFSMVGGMEYRRQATSQDYYYLSNYGPFQPVPLSKDTSHTAQYSGYALLLYSKNGFSAGAGGRFNHHSVYGNNATFSFNPAYNINKIKLFLNIASAYRVPSLYQLYSEYGNKMLKPEQSVSYEIGAEYNSEKLFTRVTGFQRNIRDVFYFYTNPVTYAGTYINEDRQDDLGIETEASFKIAKELTLSANNTFVTGNIYTKDNVGKDTSYYNLYRRPKNIFNFNAEYKVKKLLVSAHLRITSSTLEPLFGASPQRLNGYYTADFHSEYHLSNHFRLYADIRNFTNQRYFDQWGFATWGINFRAGVQVSL
jgi:vitamin B12 transporter